MIATIAMPDTKGPFTLGWDLGGAHVKAVLLDVTGTAIQAIQSACPLWRGMEYLQQSVDEVLAHIQPPVTRHVVTMTGELADIFSSRDEGVQQLSEYMIERFGVDHVRLYAGRYGLISGTNLAEHSPEIASANWLASASFLATMAGDALLIDVGSTTTDLMLLCNGEVMTTASTDAERMRRDELIYTGVVRTPVMSVVQHVPFDGDRQGVAAEHFATMADVYRLTGDLAESHDMAETADGAGKSPAESARRLARMVGRDLSDASLPQWRQLACAIKSRQLRTLQEAAERALSRGLLNEEAALLGAGAGRFLVRDLARQMGRPYQDVSAWVKASPEVADWAVVCLPAYAVARLSMREAALQ